MGKAILTAGHLADILCRAAAVITETEGADEHDALIVELTDAAELIQQEIAGSHMGSGADVVLIERSDDGNTGVCGNCGDEVNFDEHDRDTCRSYRADYDEYVACGKCGQSVQLLDWNSASHRLTCGVQPVPAAEQARIAASAAAHGVTLRFEEVPDARG